MKKILHSVKSRLARFAVGQESESAATAVEYAVMLALICVVCIAAIGSLGTAANNTFTYVGGKVAGSSGS